MPNVTTAYIRVRPEQPNPATDEAWMAQLPEIMKLGVTVIDVDVSQVTPMINQLHGLSMNGYVARVNTALTEMDRAVANMPKAKPLSAFARDLHRRGQTIDPHSAEQWQHALQLASGHAGAGSRIYNNLVDNGLDCASAVAGLTEARLRSLPKMGNATVKTVLKALSEFDVALLRTVNED